jgi:hypothetical protein
MGRLDSVLPESAAGENVEPAVDDAGLGSGVEASSGDVSIGDAVFKRIRLRPEPPASARLPQEYLTRHALASGRARFVHEVLRHRRPCGRWPLAAGRAAGRRWGG